MKQQLDDDGLSLHPQHIRNKFAWYYETKRGIEVIHEMHDNVGAFIRTDIIVIPWRKVRASLDRYDNKRTKP